MRNRPQRRNSINILKEIDVLRSESAGGQVWAVLFFSGEKTDFQGSIKTGCNKNAAGI